MGFSKEIKLRNVMHNFQLEDGLLYETAVRKDKRIDFSLVVPDDLKVNALPSQRKWSCRASTWNKQVMRANPASGLCYPNTMKSEQSHTWSHDGEPVVGNVWISTTPISRL